MCVLFLFCHDDRYIHEKRVNNLARGSVSNVSSLINSEFFLSRILVESQLYHHLRKGVKY